jgi:hypothetical protein
MFNWIAVAHDGERWRALLKAAMHLLLPENVRIS